MALHNDMTYTQQLIHAWKRSITSWFTQHAQLYGWSVISGFGTVIMTFLQYAGALALLIASVLLAWLLSSSAVSAMACVALSMLILRQKTLHLGLYFRLYDMYQSMWNMVVNIAKGRIHSMDDYHVRGTALDHFVLTMGSQLLIWVIYAGVVVHIFHHNYIPWQQCVYIFPWIPFTCFFILDAGGMVWSVMYGGIRGLRMVWYNVPLCLAISGIAYVWSWIMQAHPLLYAIDIASIPFWISVWYTVYVKSIYEQFSRYYRDKHACGSDTA